LKHEIFNAFGASRAFVADNFAATWMTLPGRSNRRNFCAGEQPAF